MKSTNYYNTFIAVAEDCPLKEAEVPPVRDEKKSIANMQFEWLIEHPYEYTSDDIIFGIHAKRGNIPHDEYALAREKFFSKGQPCFRSSPLAKRYGWGVHSNEEGKLALIPLGSENYSKFLRNDKLKVIKAMRSKKSK